MRVVIDVNVWISALLWRGVPRQVVDLAVNQQITIFASEVLFGELEITLKRAKFQKQIMSLPTTADDLTDVARSFLQWCEITFVDVPQLRDPKDAMILATALSANAEAIITGDRDLLILKEFSGIPILTPQNFLKLYFPNN
ncbi:putative toxin-antitoxin system toxin component, PIN family [Oscillatoriales cyanobacterium USR001]|nr:putative toxin-antitoxin system toxin component, PIN family [Oscillatoriales cyanobacterium USR001]